MQHEPIIRLACFAGVFAVMAVWEIATPRRVLRAPKGRRWFANLAMVAIDSVLVRIIMPSAAVGAAAWAASRGWGLFNLIAVPHVAAVIAAVIALDFVIYAQHVLFHAVPMLWRVHRVHHADVDVDVTTGLRFHPVEIVASMLLKMAAVVVLGAPVVAVLVFEVVLNATAMFNHSNVRLPVVIDRVLRLFVVTPDMHRVHHSVEVKETNSNFGFNLPWWDRLCGTYKAVPESGLDGMVIGLAEFQDRVKQSLGWLLALPFISGKRR